MLRHRTISNVTLAALAASLAISCSRKEASSPAPAAAPAADNVAAVNGLAERYVKLALAFGRHDKDYVDAYYGPAAWKTAADAGEPRPLAEIRSEAEALRKEIDAIPPVSDEMPERRRQSLSASLRALGARAAVVGGEKLTFEEESRLIYDTVAPRHPEEHFRALVSELDKRLPGSGEVSARLEKFRKAYVIPKDKVDAVFQRAIAEARERTRRHIPLPEDERFTLEYVRDKTWSGYNWYQGNHASLIQINTDLPIYIDRALDLACHEGYPGHHVYNLLAEKELSRGRGWVEYTLMPLFSARAIVAEGSGNYGIDVAFPGAERAAFERDVLFPMAGLDPKSADAYAKVREVTQKLSFAGNEAARRYLDGEIDAKTAADWLTRYALMEPARAAQRVRFMDQYRSYVINYNWGEELVRRFIESRGGTAEKTEERWKQFTWLLTRPILPSELGPGVRP
jgi:hypothetical protein